MKSNLLILAFSASCAVFFSSCKKKDCPEPPKEDVNAPAVKNIALKLGPEAKDAQVNSNNPNQNYDNYFGMLHVMAATWGGTPGATRVYMQFDYSSLPANAVIQSVKLKLYADTINVSITGPPKGHTSLTGPNEVYVKRVTSAWSETSLTWNNQPSSDNVNRLELPASTSRSQTYIIDVTQFAKDEIANPSKFHGIMLQMQDEIPYRAVAFRSTDDTTAARRPELDITYIEK